MSTPRRGTAKPPGKLRIIGGDFRRRMLPVLDHHLEAMDVLVQVGGCRGHVIEHHDIAQHLPEPHLVRLLLLL